VALNDIDTVVFLMMENRSFDHMLGYLSLDETAHPLPVEGLRSDPSWRAARANKANGKTYPLRRLGPGQDIVEDPPHGEERIAKQIDSPPAGPGPTQMGGFVSSFLDAHPQSADPGIAMSYYDAASLPTYDFFARNYCVCDHWHAPLPLGTQANRLMAMGGESRVIDNVTPLPDQDLVYDWLNAHHIDWRAYVSGGYAPFFLMMKRWSLDIIASLATGLGRFRRFGALRADWSSTKKLPPVLFIEPEYADAPASVPNDDHPPAHVSRGQAFLNEVYNVLTSNKARWAKTLLIVTYDEHGGLFDHVPPLTIEGAAAGKPFHRSGPRVPAFLISPFVAAGQVFSEPLDHTSFLTLLTERFGGGQAYSPAVAKRQAGLGRIAHALSASARSGPVPTLPAPIKMKGLAAAPAVAIPAAPDTPNAAAIDAMARELRKERPDLFESPGLAELNHYLDTHDPVVARPRDNVGRGPSRRPS
jgi:phospholipase C